MAHPLLSKLKFLKSRRLWGFIVGICCVGGYAYWTFRSDDRELRVERREWAIGLLFPAVVVGGGYWLNQQAEKRTEQEQKKAKEEANLERQEQREQSELKDYFDRMSTLVVERDLGSRALSKSESPKQVLIIAKALTVNILREVSEERMEQIVWFLKSLGLVGMIYQGQNESGEFVEDQDQSIFEGVDLNNADLEGFTASELNFYRTNLRYANLKGANLFEVAFCSCDLTGVDFQGATLIECSFYKTDLTEASLVGVDLTNVTISSSVLKKTRLSTHLSKQDQEQCKKEPKRRSIFKPTYDPIIVESEE